MGSILFPVLLILLLFFMLSRNRRRQQQQAAKLREALVPGARVMTTSGLYANVIEIHDTTVVLEIAPGFLTTWSRAAVSRAIEDEVPATPAAGATSASTVPVASESTTTTVSDGPAAGPGASVNLHKSERPEL